jgi:predicted site-specific integrase-resolvase
MPVNITRILYFNYFPVLRKRYDSLTCVIYTRVSSKEQADTNMSLDTQRKYCERFAQKNGYTIIGYFGDTYESAKTDERREFNKILALVKKSVGRTKKRHTRT